MTIPLTLSWREIRAAHPKLDVQILQRLGIDTNDRALTADGKVGPRTEGATYLNPAKVASPVALVALSELLRGAGETVGNNRGPDISQYMGDDNPNAQQGPWCAGFATWCLRQVYADAKRSLNARRSVSGLKYAVVPRLVRPDDLIAWERRVDGVISKVHGHVEIVVAVDGDAVWTIGGNVDVRPGAGGDGVGARRYSLVAGLRNRDGNACVGIGRHVQPGAPSGAYVLALALVWGQALEVVDLTAVDLTATQAVAGLVALGAGLYVLVEVIKRLLPEHVTASPTWSRLLPVLAPLIGAALTPPLVLGWSVEGVPIPWVAHALAGLVAGWMGGGLYSTLEQTLRGRDLRIKGDDNGDGA
jgi:hypothetical protein